MIRWMVGWNLYRKRICLYYCILIWRCMQNHNNDTIKTSDTVLRKIYFSLYLKGFCVRGSWRPNRTATYWPPLLWLSAFLSRSPALLNRDFNPVPYCQPSSTSPMEYALPLSLEWHVWPGRRSIYYSIHDIKHRIIYRILISINLFDLFVAKTIISTFHCQLHMYIKFYENIESK